MDRLQSNNSGLMFIDIRSKIFDMRRKKPASRWKHKKIIKSLEQRLSQRGRKLLVEFKYSHKGAHEADLIVIDDLKRYAYAFEVKSTDSKKSRGKAIKQLSSDKIYIQQRRKIERVYTFYVSGRKG